MRVTLGVSNRHIHLNEEDYKILFGNKKIKIVKKLVQKNQYASNLFVTLKTNKSNIKKVRVVGPIRNYTQVEISKTDAINLGINPPVRESGNLKNAAKITIIGPEGKIEKNAAIIADRHIHLSPKDVKEKNLIGVKEVSVKFNSKKGTTFDHVKLKVQEEGVWELHLDTDDANGSLLKTGDKADIIISK